MAQMQGGMTNLGFTIYSLAITVVLAAPALAVDITGCGQEVPAGEVGILTTDINCGSPTATNWYGVELENGATLDLQGHTITGPDYPVYCEKRCSVTSTAVGRGMLRGGLYGLAAADGKATVSDVDFVGNQTGIVGTNVALRNVSLVDNAKGAVHLLDQSRLVAENVSVSGCTQGNYCIGIGRIRLSGFTVAGTATGYAVIWGKRVRLAGGSIVGGNVGIRDEAGSHLENVALSGNGVDIESARRPRLVDSACETSRDLVGTPWGVCSND